MIITIIVPTYNEAENIRRFLSLLLEEIALIKDHQMKVLVVDGHSPDGTAGIVQSLRDKNPHLFLLEKEKEGLGADYLAGMQRAMNTLHSEVIIEMDADFQHDPRDVKRFVAQIDAGYDYVIGSRYVAGGSIPEEWAWHRRMISVIGNGVARLVLWLPSVTDYTTGFKASRVKGFLDQINLARIFSAGYAYKIHLLSEMADHKAKIKEIPIAFGLRDKGSSKMAGNDLIDSLKVVFKVRFRKSERFFKFLVVGLIGLVWQWLLMMLLRSKVQAPLATALGGEAAVVSNFILNNLWTFQSRAIRRKKFILKFFQFNLTSVGAILLQSLVVLLGNFIFGQTLFVDNLFFFLGLILVLIWNFSVYNHVIWRDKS